MGFCCSRELLNGTWDTKRAPCQGAVVITLPGENNFTMGEKGNQNSTRNGLWGLVLNGRFDV